ncbi:MAG: ATP-binding protein [Selenomonadaceae bacterium]|nr:ATP-binding protein [Selenomonadaceae bacterium]
MGSNFERRWLRPAVAILTLITVLAGIGYVLHRKIDELLYSYIELQVTRQTQILAKDLDGRVANRELYSLANIARAVERVEQWGLNEASGIDAVRSVDNNPSKGRYGIIDHSGNAVYGDRIDADKFPSVRQAFHGEPAVSGNSADGWVSATPVMKNGNVRYVLYHRMPPSIVAVDFGIRAYEGQAGFWVVDSKENMMVAPIDWDDERESLLQMARDHQLFRALDNKLLRKPVAAVWASEGERGLFLVKADVPSLNGELVGLIPLQVMMATIGDASMLVGLSFGFLCIIVMVGMFYAYTFEEKSRQSDELRDAIADAARANSAKSDFLANMSHEIRTPINAIMGMNEMILREGREPVVREYAQNIESASKALLSLVNDILDFSKVEAGKMDILPGNYRLGKLLSEVSTMINVKAEEKQLNFIINVSGDLPDQLEGDAVRIRQVLINLLNNAVKYTNEGGITLTITGQKLAEESDTTVFRFAVADTGIGIKPEDMDKLFKNFVRLDINRNRSVEGTGLGLALTQRLAQAMGGSVEVTSEYGVGTTFTFVLPQKVVGPAKVGNFQAKNKEAQKGRTDYRVSFIAPEANVLVVDDRELNLMVVSGLLKETKVNVVTANSGAKSLELMKKESFDVVLMDHMMPGMSGIEAMEQAREIPGYDNIPFIVLTANAIVGMREMYLSKGFVEYLSKPIDGNLLEDTLRKFLPPEKVRIISETPIPTKAAPAAMSLDSAMAIAAAEAGIEGYGTGGVIVPPKKPAEDNRPATNMAALAAGGQLPAAGLNPYLHGGAVTPAAATVKGSKPEQEKPDDEATAIFNAERGCKNCGNKKDMYNRVLSVFCDEAPNTKAEIAELAEKQQWDPFTVAVHALKSSSLLIGGEKLSRLAKAMEMAGRKQQGLPAENPPDDPESFIANNVDMLMLLYDDTVTAARKYLAGSK